MGILTHKFQCPAGSSYQALIKGYESPMNNYEIAAWQANTQTFYAPRNDV
jgi:hypothetical protein